VAGWTYSRDDRRRRTHGHRTWWPGADLPEIRVPPQTVCRDGNPSFVLRGIVVEGPDLHGWQRPLVTSLRIEAPDGYPQKIWVIKGGALRTWRTILPGDEVEVDGFAFVVHRRKGNPRIRNKDIYLVTYEVTLVASKGGDDAERTAQLLARQLDPVFGATPAKPLGERPRRS